MIKKLIINSKGKMKYESISLRDALERLVRYSAKLETLEIEKLSEKKNNVSA